MRQDGRVSEIPETDESAEQVQPETPADVPDELRQEWTDLAEQATAAQFAYLSLIHI